MRLGKLLKIWRLHNEIGVRELAKQIGVSHGTISRIERGENVDGKTIIKILMWLFGD